MTKRKAFLAKLLAAAIAVTAVLPGAMTAQAATIVTITPKDNAEKTDTWSQEMGEENVGGEFYWHLQSSATSNNNNNSDYSAEVAPAVILDGSKDFTVQEGEDPKTVDVDIYPNGTSSTMRFGIMVKYVDPTHWAYLNYDTNKWLLEYKCDSVNGWPSIPELADATLEDYRNTRVTLTYTAAGQIDLAYTPQGGETIEVSLIDSGFDSVLSALETYAATAGEDGAAAPIRFGFKAGSYSTNITDVNLKNMELNGESLMNDDWAWVKERDGQVFQSGDVIGGVSYAVLTGTNEDTSVTDFENGTVSAVIRPKADNQAFALEVRKTEAGSVKAGFDGSKWYYAVGANKVTAPGAAPKKDADVTVSVTVENGRMSADVVLEEGAEPTVLASDVDVSAVAKGSIALETAAELWVRDVNYTKKTVAAPEALQAEYDRVVKEAGKENKEYKYYSDKWATYEAALTAAEKMLASEEEIQQSDADKNQAALTAAFKGLALVDKTALQAKYDELGKVDQGLYTEASWKEFQGVLTDAKAVLDKIDGKQSVASTDVSGALRNLNTAMRLLEERAATAEEKAGLKKACDEAAAMENKCYTEKSWKHFTDALEAAQAILESEDSTNSQVTEALNLLAEAQLGLEEQMATAEDLQELLAGYDSVKATANAGYTAESWKAFQDALTNAQAVLAKGDAATQYEVKSALKALQDTKAALSTVKVKFAQASYTVEATASVATKVEAGAAVTYKTSDPSVATVDAKGVVTGVKAGKAVITAESAGVKATAAVTVTTPKITLTAKKAALQVKKSTKAIQVETKIATDSVVSWKSSNVKVATVSKTGKVKAKKTGTTKLTVTMKSGATATCTLKVQKNKVVTKSLVVAKKAALTKGQTYSINAKRNPITATEKITYTSSNKKVAAVSKKGVIKAKAKGTSKITVKCNGKKKVLTVTVK